MKHKVREIDRSITEANTALLKHIINMINDDSLKLTSGQLRSYLLDLIALK